MTICHQRYGLVPGGRISPKRDADQSQAGWINPIRGILSCLLKMIMESRPQKKQVCVCAFFIGLQLFLTMFRLTFEYMIRVDSII